MVESRIENALNSMRHFFKMESAGGLLLMAAAVLAIIFANTALSEGYRLFLETPLAIKLGGIGFDKPLLLWINDGLMTIFFLLVGMEIKREVLEGQLSTREQAVLPLIAALGGMIIPACIYSYINWHDPVAMHGWAIPTATDIAFALGILLLFGKRVPLSLKIFLTAVAVIDDLGAIVIIALFYSHQLSMSALLFSAVCIIALLMLNLFRSRHLSIYILLGILMWAAVLKSGVHATLAGVILGILIPLNVPTKHNTSMLRQLEHGLHPWVAFAVLPIFAFANAGISLKGISTDAIMAPIPLGIAVGLFLGKQTGIFALSAIAVKLRIASLPTNITWKQFYAVCILCGVGFTMSLFIGTLAFRTDDLHTQTRIGVMIGSLISACVASLALHFLLPKLHAGPDTA